jgi:hypothetical protein
MTMSHDLLHGCKYEGKRKKKRKKIAFRVRGGRRKVCLFKTVDHFLVFGTRPKALPFFLQELKKDWKCCADVPI